MRYSATIERIYRKRPDGLYQEYLNHFIHIVDSHGNKTTKLDKSTLGRVYKEAQGNDRSNYGEGEFIDPNTGSVIRLVALGNFQQG